MPLQKTSQTTSTSAGAQITQADLDRVWKPIFEEYNGGEGSCKGCTMKKLRIPLSCLKVLLTSLPTDLEAGASQQQQQQQQHLSRRNQARISQIENANLPMPLWVLELVTKKADVDADGWVEYKEFCAIMLEHKGELTSTHLTGLEKV